MLTATHIMVYIVNNYSYKYGIYYKPITAEAYDVCLFNVHTNIKFSMCSLQICKDNYYDRLCDPVVFYLL